MDLNGFQAFSFLFSTNQGDPKGGESFISSNSSQLQPITGLVEILLFIWEKDSWSVVVYRTEQKIKTLFTKKTWYHF